VLGCIIFRNNLNEFWDFYHGTKPPTWLLVHPKALSTTLLILAKSQTPQGYLLEENKTNKRMQGRSANITREKPPQPERERERLVSLSFMGPVSLSLHVRLPLGRVQRVHSSSSSYPVPCSLSRLTRIHNFSCLVRLHENDAAAVRLFSAEYYWDLG
jgi:hypothetical protein